jgi:uncharacterized membrane protein
MKNVTTGKCQISGRELPLDQLMPGLLIRDPIAKLIREDHPEWDANGYVAIDELKKYRYRYIESIITAEKGEISQLDRELLEKMKNSELLARNIYAEDSEKLTFGQRLSDRVAALGGTWGFIISFAAFLFLWIATNVCWLTSNPPDPYPFILLNLILSCIAAIQAPVIMMSQNRQSAKDRQHAEHDYQVNLKAEMEIQQLHEKLDHLLIYQGQRMLEIQQMQMDAIEQILSRFEKHQSKPDSI